MSSLGFLVANIATDAPKEIYYCPFPRCQRWFVRQDLCTRHHERHFRRSSRGNDLPAVPSQEANISNGLEPNIAPREAIHDATHVQVPISPSEGASADLRNEQSPPTAGLQQLTRAIAVINDIPNLNGTEPSNQTDPSNSNRHDTTASRQDMEASESLIATGYSERHGATQDTVDQNVMVSTIPHPPVLPTGPQTAGPGLIVTPNDQPFSESPSSIRDDFTTWLFDNTQSFYNGLSSSEPLFVGPSTECDLVGMSVPNYFANPFGSNQYLNTFADPSQVDAVGDTQFDTTLSSERRRYLIEFMRMRFIGGNEPTGQFQRDQILQGNHDSEEHILNLRLMRSYIASYWQNFHDQFPILHKPTFSADNASDLLSLAVMAIGASLLGNEYGMIMKAAAKNFANFVAWHLRWQVYMDSSFHPPAKLWVFQTLLLLEIYEKMNATRALHERANIHYATTINLMRRSTALDEDLNLTQRPLSSPQEWWERWINAEATRRVAYAAFLLDATHATMFGHSAVMVVQEIRLPLPCDETLWSATSPAEVGLVESSLHANAIRPTTFIQGLKRTLTGRKVRTSSFGRLALMAGLLSISWHMRQRELQMSTLGVPHAIGVPETWRSTLISAFDFWKQDFDEDIAHMKMAAGGWPGVRFDNASVSDQATVLHHLSQLAMQIDVVDCQIAAGARAVMGRAVTKSERDRVQKKMINWCKTEGARQAAYHAIQLLQKFVTIGTENGSPRFYSARDDCLLSRPWVLYFAALTIWCQNHFNKRRNSFSAPHVTSPGQSLQQTQGQFGEDRLDYENVQFFLSHAASKSSVELASLDLGDRNVVSLLQLLDQSFRDSRWELLHEAADRLREAISITRRGNYNPIATAT